VRFIELIDVGASANWDAHSNILSHEPLARNVDQPIAGLLKDLKSRGMLDDTLVVWTTEFGRSPHEDGPDGRSHYNKAFSSWMAGGGVKPGIAWGQTDDFGANIAENEVHVHDFHATILHLLGFDHTKLTFRYAGRDFRLTDVAGNVVNGLLA
jgi:arylsulfatase A-like enzyme